MTPIVHGLGTKYADRVDFRILDAASGEGRRLFQTYGLAGHPGYILLDQAGIVQWQGIGQVDTSLLEDEILRLLDRSGSTRLLYQSFTAITY